MVTELEAAQELLRRRRARTGLANYIRYVKPHWEVPPHQEQMAAIADLVAEGIEKRVIVQLPYRQLKSETWSRDFPAYYSGRRPSDPIITVSDVFALAEGFGRDVRNRIASREYQRIFPGVSLRQDSTSASRFHIVKEGNPINGSYQATSIGGQIMGQGLLLGVIDDPHKDFLIAQDRKNTDRVWDWYTQVFFNRLQPGAAVVVICQGLSEHDLPHRLIEHGKMIGKPWKVIKFPAMVDERGKAIVYHDVTDLAKLRKGKPLWSFYGVDHWVEQAATGGPSQFMAMAQQEPIPFSGQIIKAPWVMHWAPRGNVPPGRVQLPERFDRVLQSWDLTFKATVAGSYVVGQVWGEFGPYRALLDQVRGQWGFMETCQAIESLSSKWPEARKKLIEAKANGEAVENSLNRKIAGIELVNPGTLDKAAGMRATEAEWASHHILLPPPESHSWVPGYIQRLLQFPSEPNDEGDATSQGLNYMSSRFNVLAALTREDGPNA